MDSSIATGEKIRPSAPRRIHLFLLALAFIGIATYGSFVPFKYHELDWDVAVERFQSIGSRHPSTVSRADWVSNVLLFVPVSYFAIGTVLLDRRRALLWALPVVPAVMATCVALSIALEFGQLWFPPRNPSVYDIQAQTIGSMIGAAGWFLAGQWLINWVRGFTSAGHSDARLDRFLQIYVVGLLIYSVIPLNVTIHPQEIYRKLELGRLELIPFSLQPVNSIKTWLHVLTNMLLYVPVGAWGATVWRRPGVRSRSLIPAIAIGMAVAVGTEVVQLFIFSATTSTTEVISGTMGVVVGAWLLRHFTGKSLIAQEGAPPRLAVVRFALSVAILAYSVALCVFFWWPMELLRNGPEVKRRMAQFFAVPFSSLQRGSEFNAATEIVRKTMLFAVLGVLWIALIRTVHANGNWRIVFLGLAFLYCLVLATGIELAQAAFPPRVCENSDVILYTGGAILGMMVMSRILPPSQRS